MSAESQRRSGEMILVQMGVVCQWTCHMRVVLCRFAMAHLEIPDWMKNFLALGALCLPFLLKPFVKIDRN